MHLVDEEDVAPAELLEACLRRGDGLTDVLDAGKDRGERDELGVEGLRHQACEGRLARAWRPPENHRMRAARLEGEAQRLAGAEQVLLSHHLVERFRPQRVGERRDRLRSAEKVGGGHYFSPRTSAPLGGAKRNSAGLTFGLRSSLEKRSSVVWPKLSVSCIACRPCASKPRRTRSKPASRSRGLASIHSRPSFSPASESAKACSMPLAPARRAAGVEPSAVASLRTVTWFNCGS